MPDLSVIPINNDNDMSRERKASANIITNHPAHSSDVLIHQTPLGTHTRVKNRYQNSISANSGPTHYVTAQIFGDYYKCYTYAGTIISGSYQTGSTPVWVAKPPELRHSVVNELIENTQVTYSYASRAYNADGQRTATVGGSSITQTEIIQPVYHCSSSLAGDGQYSEIWADMPSGGTGCTGSTEAGGAGTGSLLIWMDTNRSARKWNWVS